MEYLDADLLKETLMKLNNFEIDTEKFKKHYIISKFDSKNFNKIKSIIESLGFGKFRLTYEI